MELPLRRWASRCDIDNPPYGERISVDDMNGLYALLGSKLRSTSGLSCLGNRLS